MKTRLIVLLIIMLAGCSAETPILPILPESQGGNAKSDANIQAKTSPVAKPAEKPKWLDIKGEPAQGDPKSPITMVGFSDFQCLFCAHFAMQTLPQIEREFIQTGQLNFVFRDVPIEKRHPKAMRAAVAAQCAGEQKKFWPMHNLLFASAARLEPDDLLRHALTLGLNQAKFKRCLQNAEHEQGIHKDIAEAAEAGVKVTPTFYLGYTPKPGDKMEVKAMLAGSQPFELFKKIITDLLKLQDDKARPTKP